MANAIHPLETLKALRAAAHIAAALDAIESLTSEDFRALNSVAEQLVSTGKIILSPDERRLHDNKLKVHKLIEFIHGEITRTTMPKLERDRLELLSAAARLGTLHPEKQAGDSGGVGETKSPR